MNQIRKVSNDITATNSGSYGGVDCADVKDGKSGINCSADCSGDVPLSLLRMGQRAIIKSLESANPNLLSRLLTMGLVNGTAVELVRVAPLGDPIQIKALGYRLSLRLNEAACVSVIPDSATLL